MYLKLRTYRSRLTVALQYTVGNWGISKPYQRHPVVRVYCEESESMQLSAFPRPLISHCIPHSSVRCAISRFTPCIVSNPSSFLYPTNITNEITYIASQVSVSHGLHPYPVMVFQLRFNQVSSFPEVVSVIFQIANKPV